jgi:hypothetical protein
MTTAAAPVAIPFTLRFGHVLLDARVNGRPSTLVLDTGSGACCIDAEWGREQQFVVGREAKAVGTGDVGIRLTTLESLSLGNGVELRNEMAALVPLHDVSAHHGCRIHGTVGFPIFSKYVVEIDYAARVLRLHEPQSFQYEGRGERLPLDLSKRVPVVNAQLVGRHGEALPARFLLDLGTAGYGALLTKPFVDRHSSILNEPPFIERPIGAGVGGAAHGRITMVSALGVAGLTVRKPIVALPSNARGFFGLDWVDGTVGAPILSRTRLIMDYPHAQVIIEPRESWDAPFEYDLSGLTLCAQAPAFELVTIDDVTAESPADAAGLKLGDIVRSVDGRLVSGASLEWIAERLTVPEARYAFRVERNGELVDLELKLGTATFLDVR